MYRRSFHEEELGELCQHRLSARARRIRLLNREGNRAFQPPSRRAVANIDFEDGWKSRQKHTAQLRIAGHAATYEPGDLASSSCASKLEAFGKDAVQFTLLVHRLDLGPIASSP